ncbi:rhomboid protease GluP [Bacillus ectoiniformans]|uniref:rhomboid family intramembrane serine protease n=1 Tax=Bacillus ectoiniformans TaxID=1494429 RepID=UPI00195C4D6C|nr:rhomboid family intramembrane serine protease [Bacillus ectoiniformans]MBM7650048.1 rhomboid protease GluP [Bacillus ectoiniformans]
MSIREEYLFWRLAHLFVVEQDYHLARLSDHRDEIWLENFSNKSAQVVRIVRKNLDWSSTIQRDVERASAAGERIRKQVIKRNLTVLNLYVTPHAPVDHNEQNITRPFFFPKGEKTKVESILFSQEDMAEAIERLQQLLDIPVELNDLNAQFEEEAAIYQRAVLSYAVKKNEEDQQLFNFSKPFFTYLFITVQMAIFLMMELKGGSTNSENLIRFGAKFNPLILEGEWWRLITPIFLHIGFLHLLMNTAALYLLGAAVERIFGRMRFLFIYLFSGFTGAVASFLLTPNLSAGASGAIFGCFGALLYFGAVYPKQFFRSMGMNVIVVIIFNLIFGFTVPGIDNAGHIGGLIGGFLATGIVHFPKKWRLGRQLMFLLGTAALTIGALWIGLSDGQSRLDANSVNLLAQEHIQQKEYGEAYQLLSDYVDGGGEGTAETYFFLAYIELERKQLDLAEEHLQKATVLRQDFHEAYFNLSLIYYERGDKTRALELAKDAQRYKPDEQAYQDFIAELER